MDIIVIAIIVILWITDHNQCMNKIEKLNKDIEALKKE